MGEIRTRRHSDRFISSHLLLKQFAFPQVVDQRPAANVTEASEVSLGCEHRSPATDAGRATTMRRHVVDQMTKLIFRFCDRGQAQLSRSAFLEI